MDFFNIDFIKDIFIIYYCFIITIAVKILINKHLKKNICFLFTHTTTYLCKKLCDFFFV